MMMSTRLPPNRYRHLIDRIRECVRLHVPAGSRVLIASKGDEALTHIDGVQAGHFPQTRTGAYAGHHPANSSEAITHVRQLCSQGAGYFVLPWTSHWWLEHYRDFAKHLNTVHQLKMFERDVCLIYELRDAPAGAYEAEIRAIRERVRSAVPDDAIVAVVTDGDDELLGLGCREAWHFPATDQGAYAEYLRPADSAEAIDRLEAVREAGAGFLVFPPSARWWLEHYADFARYLRTQYRVVLDRESCVVVSLTEGAAARVLTLAAPAARPSPRVLSILARFGRQQYPEADAQIREIFRARMPEARCTFVTVDNALPADVIETSDGGVVLGGDNSSREFSAFDRALAAVGPEIWSYDLVHFATSAFNTLYVAYLERFDAAVLEAIAGRPACLGHIDCYNDPIEVRTYRSQHWMRSCFFFLPPAEAKALGSFVSVADGAAYFSGDSGDPFRVDAPISLQYRTYLTQWLTGGEIGQGVEWHSRFALTKDTLATFEHKARAILNEHLLSIRLRALGCRLIDVTWLSTRLRRGMEETAWDTNWRDQLAERDRDAVTLPEDCLERLESAT
jgi:hypothetical protein